MNKTTTEKLRYLTSEHETIVVLYISTECERCIALMPIFDELVKEEMFKKILFLEIDSTENHLIRKEIDLTHLPLISIFKKGIIIKNSSVENEEEFRQILQSIV
ncbi:MAG: hypothetical protein H0W61_13175 [Bacteroidetes bacterium]|nr:hypothetical protein [Bacteroidota bacterium]